MPLSPPPTIDSAVNIQPTSSQNGIPPSSSNLLSPVTSTSIVTIVSGETIVMTVHDDDKPTQSSGESTIKSDDSVGSISVSTEVVTVTSVPQHPGRVSNGGVAGIAIAISIFLLLVLAGAWLIWKRRHHRRSSGGVSGISQFAPLTQQPDPEIRPAYPSTPRDTKLRPVSGKTGLPPLPEYGYTAPEPQIHSESELKAHSL
ncbi:hypothetical protein C8Q74DRAFT_1449809 [Fomes fomentarius]|nr:hypothetical protein C8Q74DRAFT_1449809 [Fomes fomentarius]